MHNIIQQEARKHYILATELEHLRKLNIRAPEHAAPYILLDGHRPVTQMDCSRDFVRTVPSRIGNYSGAIFNLLLKPGESLPGE